MTGAKMKPKTLEEILKLAREIHGDRYDYSLIKEFKGIRYNYDIICKIHGAFSQRMNNHITNKSGCPLCNGKYFRKLDTPRFIERAIIVHGNLYGYSLVEYKSMRDKVKIICFLHGIFEQVPYAHLRGQGCPHCRSETFRKNSLAKYGVESPMQTKELKEKMMATTLARYGNTHSYSKYSYKSGEDVFDSSWELAYFECHREEGIKRNREGFEYVAEDGKIHLFYPDFILDGKLVEIKGEHLMKGVYEELSHTQAKISFFKDVIWITNRNQLKAEFDYMKNKFGKDWIYQFRVSDCHAHEKKVICLETGIKYDSVAKAAIATGVDSSSISAVCKKKRKNSKGLTFEYL
jgi:hypothetical protein